jgi:hypothetical protein
MPTTLGPVQIANMALSRIGVKPIQSFLDDDSIPAEQVNLNWDLAVAEMARSHGWNCLLKAAVLVAEAQDPIEPSTPVPASTPWAPATHYAVNAYVTYGNPVTLYQALIANTSSASFVNDLTQGFWFQTDILNTNPFGCCAGMNYASGWAYKFPLPDDCLLVTKLNDSPCEGAIEEYEIIGDALYTNESQAVIKYTWANPDSTRYDSLFVQALVFKLAAALATMLRQDDTNIALRMEQLYDKELRKARARDAGEKKPTRFNAVANSWWVKARRFSTNS